ncbi:MAG: LapA family protein [Leptolyngbya sp. RL_3_1]|nr:LapA family protein [Leptolyngbya sp. RL_3_1]
MNKVLLTLVPAVWVVAMAVISVQNATPISLKFLTFESVELPFGVVLSFCAAAGMVMGGVAIALWQGRQPSKS